jgi:hypothetical protein
MDLLMLTLLNSQERTEKEFEELFKAADERFVFKVSYGLSDCPLNHLTDRSLGCDEAGGV